MDLKNLLVLKGRVSMIETKKYGDNKNYVHIGIAVQETPEKVNFFNTNIFGKSAEYAYKYVGKGDLVEITGSLTTYKNKDGATLMAINGRGISLLSKVAKKEENKQNKF